VAVSGLALRLRRVGGFLDPSAAGKSINSDDASRDGASVMSPTDFLRRYEAATCAHDLEGTLSLIADDAIYLFSDQTSHLGKKAISKVLASNFETIKDETYKLDNLHWVAASDEMAVCVYQYHWSGLIDGRPASGNGRGTSAICKVRGVWQVVHEHLSSGRI